jgi:signal transduction histidine kinase/CheY-like chemotaxis protein
MVLARLRSLGLMWRFALVGATVGILVGAGIARYIESDLTDMVLRQTAARAIDQVELGAQGRFDPRDLEAPHTFDKTFRLALQLAPLEAQVNRKGSGLLRLHVIAPDGTIVYSDDMTALNMVVRPEDSPPLRTALAGEASESVSDLSSPRVARLREQGHDGALTVNVPFRIDGKVVGAYELYHDLQPVRAIRTRVWGAVTGGFVLLFLALLLVMRGAAAVIRRHRDERDRLVESAGEAAALRRMDAMKNELISVVNHELRTPLTSIVGFTELLLTRENSAARQRQFLELLHQEGVRLTTLVDEFLDLQRIESGRQKVVSAPIDLGTLLRRAVSAAEEHADRPIALEIHGKLPLVQADVDRVRQVMANLLSNANKYSPNGGEIRVEARECAGMVQISVADQGLGMPSEAMPRLFEKFFRIDNSDRRRIQGTGLGLAIVREIVQAHGGRAWAESPGLGAGSTFYVSLPVADTRHERADVLLVEDDAAYATLLESELSAQGLSIARAGTVEEGLEKLPGVQPRLVVLDLMLPGLRGEAFLWRLRELDGTAPTVVVVTMKELSAADERELLDLGAVAVIRKAAGVGREVARIVERGGVPTPTRGRVT